MVERAAERRARPRPDSRIRPSPDQPARPEPRPGRRRLWWLLPRRRAQRQGRGETALAPAARGAVTAPGTVVAPAELSGVGAAGPFWAAARSRAAAAPFAGGLLWPLGRPPSVFRL